VAARASACLATLQQLDPALVSMYAPTALHNPYAHAPLVFISQVLPGLECFWDTPKKQRRNKYLKEVNS
jgi:hypothetical protein